MLLLRFGKNRSNRLMEVFAVYPQRIELSATISFWRCSGRAEMTTYGRSHPTLTTAPEVGAVADVQDIRTLHVDDSISILEPLGPETSVLKDLVDVLVIFVPVIEDFNGAVH